MAKKQANRGSKKTTASAPKAAKSQEEELEEKSLTHYAKTVYFGDLWKSFLRKMGMLVCVLSALDLARSINHPISIFEQPAEENETEVPSETPELHVEKAVFAGMSIITTIATVLFLYRIYAPLRAFQVGFLSSVLQLSWFGYTIAYAKELLPSDYPSSGLTTESLPFGTMYFFAVWFADRWMMSSETQAKETVEAAQELTSKKQN